MPSGSHAGSPGSHSSGGASFGGGGFGGGSHNNSSGHYFGPRHGGFSVIFFGRGASGEGSVAFAWVFMAIIAVVFSFAFWGALSVVNSNIAKIKEDYAYYQDMIDDAKANPSLIIEDAEHIIVTGRFLGDGGKYYITYTYQYGPDEKEDVLEGYTYSVFTLEQAREMYRAKTFKLVVDNLPVNGDSDSIPLNCDGLSYKDDGSYLQEQNYKKVIIVVFSIILVAIATFIVLIAVGTVKSLKKKNKQTEAKLPNSEEVKQTTPTCAYCGSTLKEGQTQCPSCGARVRKTK